jgi:hypothetical protein
LMKVKQEHELIVPPCHPSFPVKHSGGTVCMFMGKVISSTVEESASTCHAENESGIWRKTNFCLLWTPSISGKEN